jgi:superfamily II DNA or RNA helicase
LASIRRHSEDQGTVSPGQQVRITYDPARVGVLTDRVRERGSARSFLVVFPDGREWISEEELEAVPNVAEDPIVLLRAGKLAGAVTLRRTLTHIRLNGKLANVVYSMDTTNTDFYAHQFKPVLKFLNSPANGILIADEVGLGKTIEAGLIWTELRSRYDAARILVLCPAMLRPKWKTELRSRFGVEAQIVDATEILEVLRESAGEGAHRGFALIGSFQGLRPRRGWDESEESGHPGTELARFLADRAAQDPILDLLVIDEAHYLRNPGSMTARLGRVVKAVAQHVVLLSATPIHLRNEDLFHLVNLLDEDTFNNPLVFDSVLQANAPLVRARELVLAGRATSAELRDLLAEALRHPFLEGNRQLKSLMEELPADAVLRDPGRRSELAYRLETANLLGHVLTRTRKREVTEWRVQREAIPERVEMSTPERSFYAEVTEIVREYAGGHKGIEGFLLATPQRQLSSSMAAALRHWQQFDAEVSEEVFEDLGIEAEERPDIGPLVQQISARVARGTDYAELRRNDSKYARFRAMVVEFLRQHPSEKLVVFSYFRATLAYLAERLAEDGVKCASLVGDANLDKEAVLADFRDPAGPRVLLSSEVGSEGIDLQFCRVLVNYDLPWNPMRVEQRIGRLDRLGQQADLITVWNLFYADTIDDRIYGRLYMRLGIFERALGGLEAVLGEQIQQLTSELLSGRLTREQETARIDQTALAVENVRREEEELEDQATNLVAYGDYILNQVKAARELNRVITGADLEPYVLDFMRERYPGSDFRLLDPGNRTYEIDLSPEGKDAVGAFVEANALHRMTRLHRPSAGPVGCRFENKMASPGARDVEMIGQVHPLVRFVGEQIRAIGEQEAVFYPAVAVRLDPAQAPKTVSPGGYVFVTHRWMVEGLQAKEQLHFAAAPFDREGELGDEAAEQLIVRAATSGTDWPEAKNVLDLARAAQIAHDLSVAAEVQYRTFVQRMKDENNDRADLQIATLDRHLKNQKEKLEAVRQKHVAAGRDNLAKATARQIELLEQSVGLKRRKIERQRKLDARHEEVCLGVIQVAAGEA